GRLAHEIPRPGSALVVDGLSGSAPALLVSSLHQARPELLWVVVAPNPDVAAHFAADVEVLLGDGAASLYPQREALPYEDAEPHVEIGGLRVEALEAILAGRASILITTARAVQELSPAVAGLDALQLEL